MSHLTIAIEDERAAFGPGQTLRGTVRWQCADYPKTAVLRLFWYTKGRGTEDILLIDERPFVSPHPSGDISLDSPGPSGSEAFEFTLPVGPYSFSGTLISLIWALELEVGRDCTRTEFTLSPTGEEILLGNVSS